MFYDSSEFKVLESGVRLSWLQQKLNTQNIANLETVGYKSKSLSFEGVLSSVQNESDPPGIGRIDAAVSSSDAASTRADGNNVDLEKESISLYEAYAQYSMLLNQIRTEFDKYNAVLSSNM